MGILGLEGGSPTEVSVGFRRGWMRHIKIVLASAGYLAVVAAAINLLAKQPREGFGLLATWGPWPFLAMAGLYLVGHFLADLTGTVRMSFASMVNEATRTADALTQLAENGGRSTEEVRRLAIYAAQEFPSVYGRLDQQDHALSSIADVVCEIRAHQKRGSGAKDDRS
ncbi:MAG TPA: hypothetical protein VFW25_02355 [Silvibacterium sp.]|nr:hypothetical protein [Silvibacterium sp.]